MAAKKPMSDQHKAALAKGRAEGKIVREYLEGLRATKPKRGRKRTCRARGKKKPCEQCFQEALEALRQFDG